MSHSGNHTAPPAAPPATADAGGGLRHTLELVRSAVPPLHPGGRGIVAAAAGGTLLARTLLRRVGLRRAGAAVGRFGLAGTAATALFFREPKRVPPADIGVVVSAADGLVALVDQAAPPPELGLPDTPRPRVSVFLSLLDVHVQRVPVAGVVTEVAYRAGTFLSADLDKASADNERNSVVIAPAAGGDPVVVVQIAGLLARRIVCDLRAGSQAELGSTYGLIRFGSRVDVYLPVGTTTLVRPGQRMVGGETVLARLTPASDSGG
ncbi:phosphatidylserine decarboxylase [Nakamurella aerolata]|uniref:Phosphatidylserine decarboxylase proenzyme n=1 Tax=Nakamurella aerolata TaxID=1656892 RepID=A0A849A5W4_9ACTN|nr:phosphatidylserine decarboxylase [Nakamurella aerolata]NNG35447.1 phosphatidylserine decarboxylase [Nakamurella aerolata]